CRPGKTPVVEECKLAGTRAVEGRDIDDAALPSRGSRWIGARQFRNLSERETGRVLEEYRFAHTAIICSVETPAWPRAGEPANRFTPVTQRTGISRLMH